MKTLPPPQTATPRPSMSEDFRASFPQFQPVDALGRGRAGTLLRVRHARLNHLFAMRLLEVPQERGRAAFLDRFAALAEALVEFRHPDVLAVQDFGVTSEGRPWLLSDCVEGLDLRAFRERHGGALPTGLQITLSAKLGEALACARRQGIDDDGSLCDLILQRDGQVRVGGIGLALLRREGGGDGRWVRTRQEA